MLTRILPNPEFLRIIEKYKIHKLCGEIPEKLVGVWNGGGACGAFEFGAALFLKDIGVLDLFDLFVGTSAGGLNAISISKYISDMDACKHNIWDKIKRNEDIYERKIDGWAIGWQFLTGGISILDPKGLYKMLDVEFKGMKLSDLPVPVIVTTTDLGPGFCDGGFGNNSPVDIAVQHGATRICMFGCFPDMEPNFMLERSGDFDARKAAMETSAIPGAFPIDGKTGPVKLLDTVKAAGGRIMALFEEWTWNYFNLYEQMSKLDPVKFPVIKKAEVYPLSTLGESTDYTHIQDWIEAGYNRAAEVFTPEYVDNWLNG
jgi:hypothetical protein